MHTPAGISPVLLSCGGVRGRTVHTLNGLPIQRYHMIGRFLGYLKHSISIPPAETARVGS